ncbi:hypothetical protein SIN8267_00015 [Sinobacterium norvegicum]|uniref:Uncharacterized protein n=1 Tax=Sinobacterium norvegicum TaxID=1641715 RepID=A0ABN8EBR6_9GAMM|nr:hypothetical protein SIN8267_00015 [Sinobacterium norvegicum]
MTRKHLSPAMGLNNASVCIINRRPDPICLEGLELSNRFDGINLKYSNINKVAYGLMNIPFKIFGDE